VATIGPSTESDDVLKKILVGGADVARLNTKHNTLKWHEQVMKKIAKVSEELNQDVAMIIDLPKPLIEDKKIDFVQGLADEIDYLALSFVGNGGDVNQFRKKIKKISDQIGIISKIEKPEALENIDEIIEASDAVMIARGDLAVEAGFENIPGIQKRLILKCRRRGKPVIVATEMLQSMVNNPQPTRAEITDVANAVYDAADAVMLSGETTIGEYPVETVKMMMKIISATEKEMRGPVPLFKDERFPLNDESIVRLAAKMPDFVETGDQPPGYLVFTKSGRTAFSLSAFRPSLPIFAFTDNQTVMDRLLLGYNISSFQIEFDSHQRVKKTIDEAIEVLKSSGVIDPGENLIIVSGDNIGVKGKTNNIRITQVE